MSDYKYDNVKIDIRDGIGWASMNRPEKRNAMSPQLHYDMQDALERLEVDPDVRVVVITGEGGNFSAGQDLQKFFRDLENDPLERKKAIFWEYGRDSSYLRPGLEKDRSPNLALRDGKWKCLINADGTDLQLYDFSESQDEGKNVAPQHHEVAQEMAKRLLAWRKSLPVLETE